MKKLLRLILVMLFVVALVAGCDNSPAKQEEPTSESSQKTETTEEASVEIEATEEPLEEANLIMYVLGDKPKDFDEVFGKVNELSKQDINCTVETKFLSWSDYSTKYSLIFASGEEFDMIYAASWSYYAAQSVKNGFLELTDELLENYAPNCKENIPQEAWNQAKVNGKIYMLPNTQDEFSHIVYMVRGDLRKKYSLPEIKTFADFDNYVMTVAQNEEGIIPIDGGSDFDKTMIYKVAFLQPLGLEEATLGYVYKLTDPDATPIKLADMPEYEQYLAKMLEWNKAGVFSKNALNNKTALKDSFINGKSAAALHNVSTMEQAYLEVMRTNPEWEPEIYDSMEGAFPTLRTSYLGNGMAIHATSANPERALMWIDRVRYDREYYDLVMYGIEGKHWIDEGDLKLSSGPNGGDYSGYSNWGFTTKETMRKSLDSWPGSQDVMDDWSSRTVEQPVAYLTFDDSNVKNESAAVNNVYLKYSGVLNFGFADDYMKTLEEYEDALEKAGRDLIFEEWIRQKDDCIATYYGQ